MEILKRVISNYKYYVYGGTPINYTKGFGPTYTIYKYRFYMYIHTPIELILPKDIYMQG